MRYLRVFEGFRSNEDYYVEVSMEEWKSSRQDEEFFTDTDIKFFNSIVKRGGYYISFYRWLPLYGRYLRYGDLSHIELSESTRVSIKFPISSKFPAGHYIDIERGSDEYYYVKIDGGLKGNWGMFIFYKCDQIEGLKKLLKDLDLI